MLSSLLFRFGTALALLTWLLPQLAARANAPTRSLEFIENKGQWPAQVRYGAALPAGRLFVEPAGFTYCMFDATTLNRLNHNHESHGQQTAPTDDHLRAHAYQMRFVGARSGVQLTSTEPTGEVRNYLLGNDERRWAGQVGSFRRVQYAGLWAGIDAQLYENNQGYLEYDFTLAPQADADRIRLRYDHVSSLRLTADGRLEVGTSVGLIHELAPKAWQEINGQIRPVSCRYVLKGREVSFGLGRYDHSRPLIIDPTVEFSSFTGARSDNWGFTATYDQQGNMYSGGIVFGTNYPVSSGAFDTSFNGEIDMAIIKYNTAAKGAAARVWATFIGGNSVEAPHSMVVNSRDELIILGSTSSGNYPVTGNAYDRLFAKGNKIDPNGITYPNGSDLVLTRLSANGAALLGSTFLGGSGNDGLLPDGTPLVNNYGDQFRGDVAVDANDNIYFASHTTSSSFPTPNGFDSSFGGNTDAVVGKFTPDLSSLTWSSYLGGSDTDAAYAIQVTDAGEVYVAGGTKGSMPYSTGGAYHPSPLGNGDGFVARISPSGNSVTRLTYIGSGGLDQVYFLQLDGLGGVYVLGQNRGTMPNTPNTDGSPNGKQFVQKLSPDLGTMLLSFTFGTGRSTPDISPTAFLVDQCERIYVCGWGGSINNSGGFDNKDTKGLFTTPNAFQPTTDGDDFYLVQFAPYGSLVEYATFYGASNSDEHVDGGTSRFDRRGYVYQAVCGGCRGVSRFPFPPGASYFSTSNGSSNCNNAAFKIDFGMNVAYAGPNQSLCADAGPQRLGGFPGGGTWTGTGVTGSVAAGFTFTPSAGMVGSHKLIYTVQSTGTCVTQHPLTMQVRAVTPVTFAAVPNMCVSDQALTLTAAPAGGTFSGPGVQGNQFDPAAAGAGTHTLTYTLPEERCGQATRQVVVNPLPVLVAGPDTALCAFQRQAYQLTGFAPAGGAWSGPGCSPTGFFTPPSQSGPVTLTYAYTNANGCTSTATRRVMLVPENSTNAPLGLPDCWLTPRKQEGLPKYTGLAPFTHTFQHALLFASRYEWDFGDGTSSTEPFPTHTYEKAGTYLVRLRAYYNSTCESSALFVPVYVGAPFVPNIVTPNGDGLNDVFEQRLSCEPVELRVFTRWGNQVYQAADYRNTWGGAELADGVYYYRLTTPEGRSAKGWLEIRH